MENGKSEILSLNGIRSISDFFFYFTEKYAEQPLFVYGPPGERNRVTYREFREAAEKCALQYLENGFSGGKKIALLGENSYGWILNFFGIELSGNIAVLPDKAQRTDSLSEILRRTDVDLVVFSGDYAKEAGEAAGAAGIPVRSMAETAAGAAEGIFQRRSDLEHREAVIAFTSGTTGIPKGVVLRHSALVRNTISGAEVFRCSGSTVLLLPLHHLYGINTCLFGSILYGACIYINSSLRYIPQDLTEALPQYLLVVPAVMNSILKILLRMKEAGLPLPESIVSAGAPINEELCGKAAELGIRVYNAYGITECAPGIAISDIPVRPGKTGMKCVTEVRIDCPGKDGCGEILVRGDSLMNGYYGSGEDTEKVLKDGWFHTGDIGFLDAENRLSVTGRLKNLIVLPNGENIAPEELESGLMNLPMVEDVIVRQEDNDLVAEIYPQAGSRMTEEAELQLKKSVLEFSRQYPPYKRITRVKIRKEPFEKTSTLKIKR